MTKKLSICMIVKDEEKNLKRCLDSLKPLLEANYAELIIVDTGSIDYTVNIAKEYTQSVYLHEWNGNFSDMRNVSISYATGEWIFIIDADEEILDITKLMDLLDSEILTEYNTVQIKVNNILNSNGNQVVHHVGERIFKNDGNFRYSGSIHNQPQFKNPIYLADVILLHYGYINDDEELMNKKFKRTSKMLLDELSKNPNHVYYRFQLARSYLMHKEHFEAYSQIKLAYETIRKAFKKIDDIPKDLYYVFIEYTRISYMIKKFEETIKIANEGLQLNNSYIDFYFYLGYAYFNLERELEGEKALSQYFVLYNQYKNDELDLTKHTTVELYSVDDDTKSHVAYKYVNHLIKVENLKEAEKYVCFIDNERYKFECLIKIIIKTKQFNKLRKIYNELNEKSNYIFIDVLENINKNENDLKQITSVFANEDSNDAYSNLNKIRLSNNRIPLIRKFLSETVIDQLPLYLFSEIYNELLLSNQEILLLELKHFDTSDIKNIIVDIIDKYQNEDKIVDLLFNNSFKYTSLDIQKVKYTVCSVLLLYHNNYKNPDETLKKLFDIFIYEGKQYVLNVYQQEKLRLIYKSISNDSYEKLFMLMILIEETRTVNLKVAISYFKETLRIYPYFTYYLSDKIQNLKVEVEKEKILKSIDKIADSDYELKILHGTIEIAGQMNTLVKGLNQINNVAALGLNYYPSYLNYDNVNVLDISKIKNKEAISKDLLEASLDTFDIFHFHFNTSIMPNLEDIPLLKQCNKKIFMHNWGTDVRLLSRAKQLFPYAKSKNEDELSILRNIQYLANYIDDCIVADAELYEYIKDYYNRVHFVRQALDLSLYKPDPTFEFRKTKPVIVHAPTASDFKGTDNVNAVIEQLKLKYDLEYKLVQNLSHEEAKEVYRSADIIIDQLHGNGHGMFSIEAMALGKPVITSISEFMADFYPKDLPIISANPNNLEIKVEQLIKDYEMRIELGRRGRKYVEKYHDHVKIAIDLFKVYKS